MKFHLFYESLLRSIGRNRMHYSHSKAVADLKSGLKNSSKYFSAIQKEIERLKNRSDTDLLRELVRTKDKYPGMLALLALPNIPEEVFVESSKRANIEEEKLRNIRELSNKLLDSIEPPWMPATSRRKVSPCPRCSDFHILSTSPSPSPNDRHHTVRRHRPTGRARQPRIWCRHPDP